MPQEFTWNDFSAGWIPSDDAQGGRKNGLLRMDNVQLDKNGALSLVGGAKTLQTFLAPAIALYDTVIGGAEFLYSATSDGHIYRNNTSITTGGDSTIAVFGNAFNYILAVSGNKRLKDNGVTTYELGLGDYSGFTLALTAGNYTSELDVDGATIQWTYNGGASTGTQATPVFSFAGLPVNGIITISCSGTLPDLAWTTLPNGGNGTPKSLSDNDIINFSLFIPVGHPGSLSGIASATLSIFTGTDGANFSATKDVQSRQDFLQSFSFKRGEFIANDGPTKIADWNHVTRFSIVLTLQNNVFAAADITLSATIIPVVDAGITPYSTHFAFYQGIHSNDQPQLIAYTGTLIAVNSSYVAQGSGLDAAGFFTSLIVPPGADVKISLTADSDAQITNFWVYREGANLGQWYRILVTPNTTGDYIDSLYDLDALEINLPLNINTVSIRGLGVFNKIYAIIGPIEGRWYYFTDKFMYPSMINDPDLADVSIGVRTCGSDNEIFLWAIKVAEGYVLVGTSVDIYVLSGTFTTLPDGVIDIYYRPMVCQHPPISRDATFANGLVYYLAADGWRSIGTNASSTELLVAPNTDQLYNNVERYGYNPSSSYGMVPGSARFPVVVAKNKLWCCVDDRIEVWDFTRRYWRSFTYNLGGVGAITKGLNGNPIAGYKNDFAVREIDATLALVDLGLQTVSLLSPVLDATQSLNRCDLYSLKVRCSTGLGENLACSLILADGTSYFIGNASSYTELEQQIILDINNVISFPTTTFQFYLTGQFTKFLLSDIRVAYDSRPNQVTALRIYNTNFGSAGKKRLRMWPATIDTLGNDVVYKPFVDNIQGVSQILNSNEKTTIPVFYNFDAFGTDYGVLLTGGPFEFYEMGQPEIVQALPGPKMYDQVGPQELFRYGKIREFELRLVSYGGAIGTTSELPYTFYFDDFSVYNGSITVNNGQEQTYSFGVPKGIAGTIIRIELGPVDYQFIRYYLRIRAMRHGNDSTDNSSWVTL